MRIAGRIQLGIAVVAFAFRGYDPASETEAERAFGWGAVGRFALFHCAVYLIPLTLFLSGVVVFS